MKNILTVYLSLIVLSLTACSAFPTEKVMTVHQGMSSDEILALFGEPNDIRVAICGKPPNQWTCTTWEYEDDFYDERASFTFSGEHDSLILNNFDVDR